VEIGHKVADSAINMTPYWEVNYVDPDRGIINLTPIKPNPFITGVGAGGKEIGDWDMEVHSGEYEQKRVDQILGMMQEGTATDPRDVAYLLKGTVPLQMGPNGAQGGWYAPTDRMANRGGNEGMDAKSIMMQDAQSLQKMGFAVPLAALDGTMDVRKWGDFVNSGGDDLDPEYQTEGENYKDPNTSAQFVLNHAQPSVKKRNYQALVELLNPSPREEIKQILQTNPEAYGEASERLWKEWKEGKNINRELEPLVHGVSLQIADMKHPAQDKKNFDYYWHLKEKAIETATKYKWLDVLQKMENAFDDTNRRWVADAYSKLGDQESVMRMLSKETDPQIRANMEFALRNIGKW
jgi:hypothetical protein